MMDDKGLKVDINQEISTDYDGNSSIHWVAALPVTYTKQEQGGVSARLSKISGDECELVAYST